MAVLRAGADVRACREPNRRLSRRRLGRFPFGTARREHERTAGYDSATARRGRLMQRRPYWLQSDPAENQQFRRVWTMPPPPERKTPGAPTPGAIHKGKSSTEI